jgi:cell division cycle 14
MLWSWKSSKVSLSKLETVNLTNIDRLYWIASYSKPKAPKELKRFYFNIDKVFQYFPFMSDFGPLNLADVYNYVTEMKSLLKNKKFKGSVIFHHTDRNTAKRANAALLMGCFEILAMKRTADEVAERWKDLKMRPFRDVSHKACTYKCTVSICPSQN